jgi:hypothetical protein
MLQENASMQMLYEIVIRNQQSFKHALKIVNNRSEGMLVIIIGEKIPWEKVILSCDLF